MVGIYSAGWVIPAFLTRLSAGGGAMALFTSQELLRDTAEIVDLVVIKAHLSAGVAETFNERTRHAGEGPGDWRNCAISRSISAKGILGTATSANWNAILQDCRIFPAGIAASLIASIDSHPAQQLDVLRRDWRKQRRRLDGFQAGVEDLLHEIMR